MPSRAGSSAQIGAVLEQLLSDTSEWGCSAVDLLVGLEKTDLSTVRGILRMLQDLDLVVGDTGPDHRVYYMLTEEGEEVARSSRARTRNGKYPKYRFYPKKPPGPPRGPTRGTVPWLRVHENAQKTIAVILTCPPGGYLFQTEIRERTGDTSVTLLTEILGVLSREGWIERGVRHVPGATPKTWRGCVSPTPAGRQAMPELLVSPTPARLDNGEHHVSMA